MRRRRGGVRLGRCCCFRGCAHQDRAWGASGPSCMHCAKQEAASAVRTLPRATQPGSPVLASPDSHRWHGLRGLDRRHWHRPLLARHVAVSVAELGHDAGCIAPQARAVLAIEVNAARQSDGMGKNCGPEPTVAAAVAAAGIAVGVVGAHVWSAAGGAWAGQKQWEVVGRDARRPGRGSKSISVAASSGMRGISCCCGTH